MTEEEIERFKLALLMQFGYHAFTVQDVISDVDEEHWPTRCRKARMRAAANSLGQTLCRMDGVQKTGRIVRENKTEYRMVRAS